MHSLRNSLKNFPFFLPPSIISHRYKVIATMATLNSCCVGLKRSINSLVTSSSVRQFMMKCLNSNVLFRFLIRFFIQDTARDTNSLICFDCSVFNLLSIPALLRVLNSSVILVKILTLDCNYLLVCYTRITQSRHTIYHIQHDFLLKNQY